MNMLRAQIICFTIFLSASLATAQNTDWRTYKKRSDTTSKVVHNALDTSKKVLNYDGIKGKVTISQDAKIDSLTSKIGRKPFINGYTIQIEVSQQKSIIRNSRYLFIRHFPDTPLDEEYDQPNTYLFAGRFYDKNSAYKFKHKIKSDFPDAIVIKKKLNLPPLGMEQK